MRKGPLPQFSHALEGHLRERLKLPVRLNEGTVELLQEKDFTFLKDFTEREILGLYYN